MVEIIEFINYIKGYLDDDYREYIDFVGAEYYFTHGGCYEFARIIKRFIPRAVIYRSNPKSVNFKDHIIVKIEDNYYDVTGVVPNNIAESNFYKVTDEEIESLTDFIGRPEVKKNSIDDLIINETELIISEKPEGYIAKLLTTINERVNNIDETVKLSKVNKEKGQ